MNYELLDNIRRHKDGSIDYSHYTNVGRIERSRQTYNNIGAISKLLRSILVFLSKRKSKMKISQQNIVDNTAQEIGIRSLSNQKAQKAA